MKYALLITIILICSYIGFGLSKYYFSRFKFFLELISFLEKADLDINFSKSKLLEIITNFRCTNKDLKSILDEYKICLETSKSFGQEDLFKNTKILKDDEKKIVYSFFSELGKLDVYNQTKSLENYKGKFSAMLGSCEEEKKKYAASAQVEQARQEAQASDARKPGEYVSKWQQQLDAAMEKILNREKFSYNLNGDALYRQYKDQAIQNGRLAMQDTLGQAAAMTGGFGSSYGQTAAQQAYRQQMANLGDKASALYDKARSEYDRQGTADKQAYDLLLQRENSSQNQYKQNLAAWEAENQRLWNRYEQARSADYSAYRDDIKDSQWLQEFQQAQQQFYEKLRRQYGY